MIMGICFLAGRVCLLFKRRSIGIAALLDASGNLL